MQRIFAVAGLTAVLVTGALAQSESDYQGWMKTNQATFASMNKEIAAKDGSAAAADAQKLQGLYKQVEAFWQARNTADAVGFSQKAETAAGAIAAAATAGNMDQAAAEAKNLQATCGGCHMAHRERTPEGTFKIK